MRSVRNAVELVKEGVEILLLSDRNADADLLPIPMAIAVSVVHHALVQAGLRTSTGIAVEAGDVRDVHHAAVLIGYGAGAVCPWLALETARATAGPDGDAKVPEIKMLKAFDAGLAKIMSKMGVSVVDSYRGAYPFDILGLSNEVVERCFPNTPAPLGGAASRRSSTASARCGARPSRPICKPRSTCRTMAGSSSARPMWPSRTRGSLRT